MIWGFLCLFSFLCSVVSVFCPVYLLIVPSCVSFTDYPLCIKCHLCSLFSVGFLSVKAVQSAVFAVQLLPALSFCSSVLPGLWIVVCIFIKTLFYSTHLGPRRLPTAFHDKPIMNFFQTVPVLLFSLCRLMAETEVVLYCDFHGHNRKNNVFMYGCDNKLFKFQERVFPLMMSKNAKNKVTLWIFRQL